MIMMFSACRWRTFPGSQHRDLSMRPLYQWGKDSISQQTSPPQTQSGQCSRPIAHEGGLCGRLKTPRHAPPHSSLSLSISFLFFNPSFLPDLSIFYLCWLHHTYSSHFQSSVDTLCNDFKSHLPPLAYLSWKNNYNRYLVVCQSTIRIPVCLYGNREGEPRCVLTCHHARMEATTDEVIVSVRRGGLLISFLCMAA